MNIKKRFFTIHFLSVKDHLSFYLYLYFFCILLTQQFFFSYILIAGVPTCKVDKFQTLYNDLVSVNNNSSQNFKRLENQILANLCHLNLTVLQTYQLAFIEKQKSSANNLPIEGFAIDYLYKNSESVYCLNEILLELKKMNQRKLAPRNIDLSVYIESLSHIKRVGEKLKVQENGSCSISSLDRLNLDNSTDIYFSSLNSLKLEPVCKKILKDQKKVNILSENLIKLNILRTSPYNSKILGFCNNRRIKRSGVSKRQSAYECEEIYQKIEKKLIKRKIEKSDQLSARDCLEFVKEGYEEFTKKYPEVKTKTNIFTVGRVNKSYQEDTYDDAMKFISNLLLYKNDAEIIAALPEDQSHYIIEMIAECHTQINARAFEKHPAYMNKCIENFSFYAQSSNNCILHALSQSIAIQDPNCSGNSDYSLSLAELMKNSDYKLTGFNSTLVDHRLGTGSGEKNLRLLKESSFFQSKNLELKYSNSFEDVFDDLKNTKFPIILNSFVTTSGQYITKGSPNNIAGAHAIIISGVKKTRGTNVYLVRNSNVPGFIQEIKEDDLKEMATFFRTIQDEEIKDPEYRTPSFIQIYKKK